MAKIKLTHKNEGFFPGIAVIGDQIWTAENLSIDDGGDGITFNEETNAYYYTYEAAVRIAKATPGWHLPTVEEWNNAADASGAGPKGNSGSLDPEEFVRPNTYGLKDRLGVEYDGAISDGVLDDNPWYAFFWTASQKSTAESYAINFHTGPYMHCDALDRSFGLTVRLVKD